MFRCHNNVAIVMFTRHYKYYLLGREFTLITDRGSFTWLFRFKYPVGQLGLAWLGLAWLGLAWLGLAWLGLAWLGLAWLGWLEELIKYSIMYVI